VFVFVLTSWLPVYGKIGIGGPLINDNGEVIGMNFYHDKYTPFLPVNIASKCLDHLKCHIFEHYLEPHRYIFYPQTEIVS